MATSRRCANNHVYDADIYASCPYCGGQRTSIQFGAVPGGNTMAPGMAGGNTIAPGGGGRTFQPGNTQFSPAAPSPTVAPGFGGGYRNPEELQKTVAPQDYLEQQRRKGHTVGEFKKKYQLDPVVGWVVCVEGADQGQSYSLYARINLIGRGDRADVQLQDMTVSKEQVKLSYDVKHNNFYLIPGDSTNTTYLNDVPLYVPTPIGAYDLIEIGETKLRFVPFCGERFQWSSVIVKGE